MIGSGIRHRMGGLPMRAALLGSSASLALLLADPALAQCGTATNGTVTRVNCGTTTTVEAVETGGNTASTNANT